MGSLRFIVRVTMISTNVVLTISTCFFCSIHAMTMNDESFKDKFNSSRSMNEDIKCATEFFVSRAKRDVRLWRRGVVPFRYDDSISREDKRVFEISMSQIVSCKKRRETSYSYTTTMPMRPRRKGRKKMFSWWVHKRFRGGCSQEVGHRLCLLSEKYFESYSNS